MSDTTIPVATPADGTPAQGAPTEAAPTGAKSAGAAPAKKLTGRMGTLALVLSVLAMSAPLSSVAGFIPFSIYFGGTGAPTVFLVTMAILLVFSVGLTTMGRHLPNPGAFYAYITAGLGRIPGLGSAFLAFVGYIALGFCIFPFIGITMNALVTGFGGPEVPWFVYALVCWVLCGVFAYRRIDLSAKVLGVFMVIEVVIIVVFNIAVIGNGGPEGPSLEPFTWQAFTSGTLGVAILFCATTFAGFEATAIYREEVKNPLKTIPRATYLSVLFIGLFYALTAWVLITAFGVSDVVAVANEAPAGMFFSAMSDYVAPIGVDIVNVLLVTSLFAAGLSVQNIASRYLFNLGTDGALPKSLGKVHPRHGSPARAALIVSAIWLLLGVVFVIMGTDPALLYGRVAGVGGYIIISLMLITSLAVIVYFRRGANGRSVSVWRTIVFPVVSIAGLGVVMFLAITNFELLIGGTKADSVVLQIVVWAVFVAGIVLALYFRAKKPAIYERIGRQDAELLPPETGMPSMLEVDDRRA